jgi:hypothetical protein
MSIDNRHVFREIIREFMRLAKIGFLRFWLLVLVGCSIAAGSISFAQEPPNSGGPGSAPPINPINPGVFPLLNSPLEDLIEPPTTEAPDATEEKLLEEQDLKSLGSVGVEQKWLEAHEGDIQELQQMRIVLFDMAEASDQEKLAHPLDRKGRPVSTTDEDIGAGDFKLPHPGFGKMKLTMCDGKRIITFIYAKKSEALIIFKKGEIDPDSEHLNRIRTGLSILGNNEKGYDVVSTVALDLQDDVVHKATEFTKAKLIEDPERWWSDRWDAIYRKPGLTEWGQGAVTGGGAQTLAVAGLSHLAMKFNVPGAQTTGWFPYVFTFLYATGHGAYNETYFNYANTGKFQALKQLPNSLFFSAIMLAHSGHMTMSVTFWVMASAMSLYKKPFSSIPWALTSKLRMNLRENAGKLRVFGYTTSWNKARVERNLMYVIPFLFVNADVFFRPWMVEHNLVFHGLTPPIAMLAGAVIARVVNTLYVFSLKTKKVSDDWSQAKAEEVAPIWEAEKNYWKRIGMFWKWPDEIADASVRAKNGTVNAYNNVVENAPKVYKSVVENAPKVYEAAKLSLPAAELEYSTRGITGTYKAITEHPAVVATGNAIIDGCSVALENLGLKRPPPVGSRLKY